jgi:hypothetical protein
MDEKLVYILLVALIAVINGLILFLFAGLSADVRDLRKNYFNALDKVTALTIEVGTLKAVIESLKEQIVELKHRGV